MHIAVVIPVHNEARHIGTLITAVQETPIDGQLSIVVVDDGSTDSTREKVKDVISRSKHVHLFVHQTNLGKGAAAKTGCDAACKLGADFIVLMDGDGQHHPSDLPLLLRALHEHKGTGLVVGARKKRQNMPFMMRFGNSTLTTLARMLFDIQVRDTQSGFRAFDRNTYPKIRWIAANYAMEMEMLILAAARNVPVQEVEIKTVYLDKYKGTTVADGVRIVRTLIKWRLLWSQQSRLLEEALLEGSING